MVNKKSEDEIKDEKFDKAFAEETPVPAKPVNNVPVTAATTVQSKEQVTQARVGGGPRILAINDDSKKAKLMLAELKEKGQNPTTVQKLDVSKKAVVDFVKKEQNKNIYDVIFVPVTNTDINKDKELREINAETGLSTNLYFDGHDDAEVNRRIAQRKIE